MSDTPIKPVGISPSGGQQHTYDHTQAVRRLQNNTQYSSRTSTSAYGAQTSSVADPLGKLVGYKTGFQDTGRLCLGVIVDGTAIANCYKVFVEKARAPMIAAAITDTSQSCFGATSINTYAPGTSVIVMVHDKIGQGYILGAVPNILDVGKRAYHDYISQASRKRVDECHKSYIRQPGNGQIVDYSAWRPWDATLASEWGAISTTGIGVVVDDFMFKAAVNEFCGVYGFYHDSMLRVAGYNMQVWTAGSERDAYMDQAEYNDTTGYSPYPWEAMGALQPGDIVEEYEPKDYQTPSGKPYYAHWENKNEFLQPYHRTQQFFGYLGQGMRTVVHAPPQGLQKWTYKPGTAGSPSKPYEASGKTKDGFAPDSGGGGADKERDHEEKPVMGLAEDNTGLDGRRFIASAKGIVLAKRLLLPMPQRLKRPESGEGDSTDKEYKAASKHGSGQDHKITGDIKTTDDIYPNMQRASAVLDLHGYLFNYSGVHPFYWHAKDYKTYEQQDLQQEGYGDANQKVPDFDRLKGSMYLKEETPKKFKVDHRYEQQNFYETECFVSLLEDGGVVIGDGYGAEIRMTGGCIFLSAPGDVWLKSGRDVQLWSGNDTIMRSNKSVDISSTEKNIRIKSEENVMILAGNKESTGGVLLESRGKTIEYDFEQAGDKVKFSGIVMRAPNSNVVSLAHQVYLRTGGGDIKSGDIVLDASTGEKDIITKSNNIYNYMKQSGRMFHFFGGQKVGGTTKANSFSENFTMLCGPLGLDKDIILNGNVLCKGSVLVSKGHIITEAAAKGAIFVAPCDGDCQAQVNAGIDQIRQLIDEGLPEVGNQIDESLLKALWYEEKRAGNDDTIPKIEFSFRVDDDYNIEEFMLYEDRWQQMARINGKESKKWEEKPVASKAGEPTWPFPGKKWLSDQQAYAQQDFKIVQTSDGFIDKERGEAPGLASEYSQPEFKQADKQTLNGNYPIIPRN
jgi:hypothetical protein